MKRQVQGFSLIEVLIAIAILGVASLALLSFFSSANFYSSTGKSTQEADLVAQSVLEEVDSCKTLTDIDSQLMAATGSAWTLVKKKNKQMTLSKKVTLNGSDYQARVLFDYDYDTTDSEGNQVESKYNNYEQPKLQEIYSANNAVIVESDQLQAAVSHFYYKNPSVNKSTIENGLSRDIVIDIQNDTEQEGIYRIDVSYRYSYNGSEFSAVVKIEYSEKRQRLAYIRLYSGVLHLRDSVRISEKEKIKITEMYTSINGELCKIDKAYSGEIVILQNEFLKLNSVLGDTKLLPQRKKIENPHPLLQTTVEPSKPEQREMLLDALLEISDSDPLLRYYVDSTTHEIILSFLGKVQMEVISALLQEKYHVEIEIKEPTVIYMERPLKKAEYTIHIEVPPNPFWASIGLSVAQLPLGSGVQYESSVSLGYLNQSFQNAVMEGIRYGCEQGLYGWNVTDCKICFKYGLYYSPVSTPADFRMLAPIVLEQVLKKAGTELLEPYLSFKIYAPQEYLTREYN